MFEIFKNFLEKVQKMASLVYPVISRSCNNLLIGKTIGKSVALPYILYGCNTIDLNEDRIKKLQVIENGVFRKLIGATREVALCALRGEISISEMKMRYIQGRLKYINSIEQRGNGPLRAVKDTILDSGRMTWSRTFLAYLREMNCTLTVLNGMTVEQVRARTREARHIIWREEINEKSTLSTYKKWKLEI